MLKCLSSVLRDRRRGAIQPRLTHWLSLSNISALVKIAFSIIADSLNQSINTALGHGSLAVASGAARSASGCGLFCVCLDASSLAKQIIKPRSKVRYTHLIPLDFGASRGSSYAFCHCNRHVCACVYVYLPQSFPLSNFHAQCP